MPEILRWVDTADPQALVERVVGELRGGRVLALAAEVGSMLIASGLASDAVRRLPAQAEPPTVALRGPGELTEWAPDIGPLGQRLTRRSWPGPLTIVTAAGVDRGLVSQLPEQARDHLLQSGS